MKKNRKILVVIFSILLTLNSYAAIVSDNDGSAFVTKSEFEALKKSFNSQIDSYNISIDYKIDGVIASYLSGIASTKVPLRFINSDWNECTEIEGKVIENKYDYPIRNLYFGFEGGNWNGSWHTSWGLVASMQDINANPDQTRIMCNAGTDPKSDVWPKYVTWEGVAEDFQEKISWARLGARTNNASTGVDYWRGSGLNAYTYSITNATNWVSGYATSDGARWQPSGNKHHSTMHDCDGNLFPVDPLWYIQNNEIEYKEANLKYKHIFVYDKIASVSVTDKDWTLHVNNMNGDDDVKWYNDAYDTGSVKGRVAAVEQSPTSGTSNIIYNKSITTFYAGNDYNVTTSNYLRPHVGLSRKKYGYDEIKQQENQIVLRNDKNVEVKGAVRDVLDTGLAMFALVKDSDVTWEFKVHDTVINPLDATPTTYAGKYKVYLAIGGFDSDITPISGSLIKNGADDHWETDSTGKCTIKFSTDIDGILYVKWIPYEGTPAPKNWASKFLFSENTASYMLKN